MIRTFEPIHALQKIVDYIWVVDFDLLSEDNREDVIMPLGHINIIFNYASDYWLVEDEQETVIPSKVVIGQMKRVKHIRYGQQLYQIGISLTPLGFIQLFHVSSLALTERFVQARDVDPDLDELYQLMMRSNDMEQHISKMNHYLLHKLALNNKDTSAIEQMLTYVKQEDGNLNIASMAKYFGVSISTLERFFKKQVGLTPKVYGDIVKFRKHVEDECLRKDIQHSYYDQSHLIKTSKKFAGKTVKELEKLPLELTLRYIWHGKK